MNRPSIDAIRQRKVEVEAKISTVIAANQAILDKAQSEKRDLNATEEGEFNKNTEAMKPLKAALAREDFQLSEVAAQLERERTMGIIQDENRSAADRAQQPTARKDGFKSFGHKMVAVARSAQTGRIDPRLLDTTGQFQASGGSDGSLNNAVPSEGGFLVDSDSSQRIYQRTYATGEITKRCMRQAISANANRLKLRIVDEDSRADGSRMGGVLAFWQNEADTFLSTRPKFRQIELVLNKLTALVFATDELLEDAPALESWIMNNLPTEMSFRVEDALFQGTGAGMPAGILNSQALLTIAKDASDSGPVFTTKDVLNAWSRFWHPGLQNSIASIATENLTAGEGGNVGQTQSAAWFIDQSVIPQLFGLTLGTGVATILLYHPPGYAGMPGPYGQLLGLPVIPTEHNNVLGTPGDVILADMSQVLLADKGAVEAASSLHVRFLQDEMTFRFSYRVDAQTTWKKPLTPKSGGPTLSPFVTVATRS